MYFRLIPEDENEEISKWQYVEITQPVILKKFAFDHLYRGISDHMQDFFSSEAFKDHIKSVTDLGMKIGYGTVRTSVVPLEDFERDIR